MAELIKRCPRCGRIYNNTNLLVCTECGSDLIASFGAYNPWTSPGYHSPYNGNIHTNKTNKKITLISAYADMYKRCLDFHSRSSRKEYWYAFITDTVIQLLFMVIIVGIDMLVRGDVISGLYIPEGMLPFLNMIYNIFNVYLLVTLFASVSLIVRRLHDTGRKSLFVLLRFIPVIGSLVILFFMAQKSVPETNEYGEPPV
ncbi:MAG: DUF805 domain-containing protein [Clostridia bacterium]|nr:DUF805 domain-containing protein [Clostridia bacterium]